MLVLVMMTLIGLAAITTTGTDIQISGNLRVSAKTFLIAEAGLQHAKRVLRGQSFNALLNGLNSPTAKNQLIGWTNFDNGRYLVEVKNDMGVQDQFFNADGNNTITVISTSEYGNPPNTTRKVIEANITRIAAGFPVFGGLGIAGAVEELEIEASARITGDPTSLPSGSPGWLTTTCDAQSGIAVNNGAARTTINNEIATNGKIKCDATNQTIAGAASTSCSSAVQVNTDPKLNLGSIQQTIEPLINYADRKIDLNANTTMQDINWGTYDNPQITVVNFTNTTGQNELRIEGASTGYGILIVNTNPSNPDGGELDLRGTFNWYGTIIFTGYSRAEFGFGGGSSVNIYGGLVLANNGDTNNTDNRVRIRGNTNIYYNCAARDRAQDYSVNTVNSWHETSS